MAAVFFIRILGDPDDLLDRVDRHAPVWEMLAKDRGLLSLTVVRTEEGVLQIETWDAPESFGPHLGDPVVAGSLRAAGLLDFEVSIEGPFTIEREFRSQLTA